MLNIGWQNRNGRWHLREPNFSPNDMIFRQTGLITHGFYAASAVLLKAGKKFIKHSGVRGATHQHLVNTGLLDIKWVKIYDRIFENRQFADYIELFEFEEPQISQMLSEAEGFLLEMKRLLGRV